MKNKKWAYRLAAGAMAISVLSLSGCASSEERLKKEENYRKIGIREMEEEDYISAIESFNQALEQAHGIGANEVDICYYKAAAQFAAGGLTDAIATYDALLEYDKKNADTWFLRGIVNIKNHESNLAKEDFANAVKYAGDQEMYLNIYEALQQADLPQEANYYLELGLNEKVGKNPRNLLAKGKMYLVKKDYDKAEEYLKKTVEAGEAEGNLILAQIYEEQNDLSKRDTCLKEYAKIYPDSSVASNLNGLEQMNQGNYKQAAQIFSEGLDKEVVTNRQELWRNLIAAYEYCGKFEEAAEEMAEYVKTFPEDEEAVRENYFLNQKDVSSEKSD